LTDINKLPIVSSNWTVICIEIIVFFFVFRFLTVVPQWVYTVVFDAGEIWGDGADPSLTVSIDAWESYLERA
jgi:hypothetical protein